MSFEDLVRDELRARSDDVGASLDLKADLMTLLRENSSDTTPRNRRPQLMLLALAAALIVIAYVAVSQLGSPKAGDVVNPPPVSPTPTVDTRFIGGTTVDLAGRTMYLDCQGTAAGSAPTVLFDQEIGGNPSVWSSVRDSLGAAIRTCAYDHAGTGLSDAMPGTIMPTAQQMADDLSALIDSAPIDGPVILVSMGPMSLTAATLVHDAPDQVAGLVFIEPREPHITDQHLAALGTPAPGEAGWLADMRNGLGTRNFEPTFDLKASETATQPFFDAPGPLFGDLPVIVLEAKDRIALGQWPDIAQPYKGQWWDLWVAGEQRYADESNLGALRPIRDAGYYIQEDRPAAVSSAIEDVLTQLGY